MQFTRSVCPLPQLYKGYRGTPCALTPNLMDCCSSDEQSAQWTIDGHNFPGCLQIHRCLHSRCVANGGPWAVVKSLSSWVLCVALPVPHTVALPRGQSPGCPLRGAGLPAGQGRLHSIPLRVWGRGLRLAQQGLFQAPPGRGTGPPGLAQAGSPRGACCLLQSTQTQALLCGSLGGPAHHTGTSVCSLVLSPDVDPGPRSRQTPQTAHTHFPTAASVPEG